MALTINGTTGIETNTDTGKLKVGASDDISIYHSSGNSYIQNDTGNLNLSPGGNSGIQVIPSGAVKLAHNDAWKFETTSSGASITGVLGFANTGQCISLGDSKQIHFGNGDDLQIFHDGTKSVIKHNNATSGNDLVIETDTKTIFQSVGGAEHHLIINDDGAVELYHNNTKQCETSANGLAFPSGKGIDFSAQTASTPGTTTNEVLDGYEEGTFTPTIGGWSGSGTGTYSGAVGIYTKVGNLVTAQIEMDWTNLTGASGGLAVQGLPFAMQSGSWGGSVGCLIRNMDVNNDAVNVVLHYGSWSSSSALFYTSEDNANWSALGIDSSGGVRATIVYQTAG
tara:strand:+ start:517 stop:1533 length:1017 start_codon:yes stop_codon:yes gene_type:complete